MENAKDVWARMAANGAMVNPPYAEAPRDLAWLEDDITRSVNEAMMSDPKAHRKVTHADGLTGKQIYARFLDNMREAVHPEGHPLAGQPRRWTLTRGQKELAQLMWRQELLIKQRAQKKTDEAQAVSVVLEYDE